MRGTHKNRPHRYPEEIKNLIIAHIKCFPTVESHFCRSDTEKDYLPEGLNISKMLRLLMEEIKKAGFTDIYISRQYYREVFNTFNLGFHKPKKDK